MREEKRVAEQENKFLQSQLHEQVQTKSQFFQQIQEGIRSLQNQKKEEESKTLSQLNDLKKLKQYSMIIQCSKCNKFISTSIFPKHLENCLSSNEKNSSELEFQVYGQKMPHLEITIGQSMVKEKQGQKNESSRSFYTEYIINVKNDSKNWYVSRQFKEFCFLIQDIRQEFPLLSLPPSCQELESFVQEVWSLIGGRTFTIEGRRKILQKILLELVTIEDVRKSVCFRQFLGELGEASLVSRKEKIKNESQFFLKQLGKVDK